MFESGTSEMVPGTDKPVKFSISKVLKFLLKNTELSFKDGLEAKVSENKGLTFFCKCIRDILKNQPQISLPFSKSCGSESSSPLKNSSHDFVLRGQLEFAGLV